MRGPNLRPARVGIDMTANSPTGAVNHHPRLVLERGGQQQSRIATGGNPTNAASAGLVLLLDSNYVGPGGNTTNADPADFKDPSDYYDRSCGGWRSVPAERLWRSLRTQVPISFIALADILVAQ